MAVGTIPYFSSIMLLTHTSSLTVGLERYIVYPPGVDFGRILMTRHDRRTSRSMSSSLSLFAHFLRSQFCFLSTAPSAQSVPTQRLSGAAVPGGRGIGIIDVEQEEIRDAEYLARAHESGGALGLSMSHEAFADATTVDGMSTVLLEGDLLAESRARPRSRAGSVRKTPSSSARAKHGSVSTPMTASATGAFVDHVIELPTDDDDDVGGKRHTPTNGKQRARTTSAGSHVTPQSVSKSSSVGLFSTAKEVEVVIRNSGGSSKDGKEKAKEKGKRKSDMGKRQTRPAEEAEEDEDAPQPAHPPKPRALLVQRRPDVKTARTEDQVEKQAPVQTSGPRRRAANVMTICSDPDSNSDGGEGDGSEVSVPPRRATGAGSATPVKSGMKPRPRSKSRCEDEARAMAAESATAAGTGKRREEVAKPTRNGAVVPKEKEKEKITERKKREGAKVTSRPRSPTRSPSPTSPGMKNSRTPKRRLSVLVPSAPKEYFSSQSARDAVEAEAERDYEHETRKKGAGAGATLEARRKQLAPVASMHAVAAEASTSTNKRGKPSPATISAPRTVSGKSKSQPQAKAKHKPGASMERAKTRAGGNEDMGEEVENNDISMVVDTPVISTSRGGPRRSAANKATTRLREEIMPDVVSFEMEQKQAKRRRSAGGESVASVRGEEEEETEERRGKRRKVAAEEEEEEEEEEAEVEDVVLVPSAKAKPKPTNGKGKAKTTTTVGSDEDMDNPPTKTKPSEAQERKGARGRGKELAAIRLMTTTVALSDDVIKVGLLLPSLIETKMLKPNVPMAQRLTKLGVQMTTKPTDCTHLVAKGIVRTEKFLCAMTVSPHMLTEEWANASAKAGKLLCASRSSV